MQEAGNLSILFDVGGVMGGIVAGYLSDRSNAPAVVSCSFVYIAIPVLYVYRAFGDRSFTSKFCLFLIDIIDGLIFLPVFFKSFNKKLQ